MIETKDLTNFARHIFSHGRGARRSRVLYPEREWFFVVGVFLVVFLVGAALSVWYYQLYNNLPEQIIGRESVSVPTYKAAAVEQTHAVYSDREERYTRLYETAMDDAAVFSATNSQATATTTDDVAPAEEFETATATRPAEPEPQLQLPDTGF